METNIQHKNIDLDKLKDDRCHLEEEIRALKKELRTTWTRPMGSEQNTLRYLKEEATELCILRAWMRGKTHAYDEQTCRQIAERIALRYFRSTTEAAA